MDKPNDTTTEMIGIKPKDTIKLDEVPLVNWENYPPEDKLPEDGLHRHLVQSGEEHDHQRHRAMDMERSKEVTY